MKSCLPSRLLWIFWLPSYIQTISSGINLKKIKWQLVSIYGQASLKSQYFPDKPSNMLEFHLREYDNKVVFQVFNFEAKKIIMMSSMDQNITHLIENNTWFKEIGFWIDLPLSNQSSCVKHNTSFATRMSDDIFNILNIYHDENNLWSSQLKKTYVSLLQLLLLWKLFQVKTLSNKVRKKLLRWST